MFTSASIRTVLDRDRVFGTLPAQHRGEIARRASTSRKISGEPLWCAGEPVFDCTFVLSGVVAVTALGPSGASVAVEFGGPGDFVDAPGTLSCTYRETTAFALTHWVWTCSIPRTLVRSAFESHAPAALAFAAVVAEQLAASQSILRGTGVDTETRIAGLLVELATRFGVARPDGSITLSMPLPRRDIARMVDTTAETVIRVLSRWRSRGLIQSAPSGFELLDVASITRLARETIVTARWGMSGDA